MVAILNLVWVPVVAFVGIAIPDKILTIPILAAFVVSLVHFVALYRLRVAIPLGQMLGAVFAAMSVQWTVARAVGYGLVKERLPFMRTAKGGTTRKGPDFPAFWEAVIGALLLVGAAIVVRHQLQADPRDQYLRAGAGGAEPAVPGGGRDRRARRLALQRVRLLAQRRGQAWPTTLPRPRGGRDERAGTASDRQPDRDGAVTGVGNQWSVIRKADDHCITRAAVSTSLTQYEVPTGITSSLKS